MEKQQAIDYMMQSTSVKNWNQRRDEVLGSFRGEVPKWFYNEIDGVGLIKKALNRKVITDFSEKNPILQSD